MYLIRLSNIIKVSFTNLAIQLVVLAFTFCFTVSSQSSLPTHVDRIVTRLVARRCMGENVVVPEQQQVFLV